MKEDLLRYMTRRTGRMTEVKKAEGPVITISREKGCPANSIARKLVDALSLEKEGTSWKWVNKQIIEGTARELHLNPSKINHTIYSEDKGFFRDLMLSFGEKYYNSDVKIKKTIAELIHESASGGNVIIVGLGGVALTKGIDKSLHIKLRANIKNRLKVVMKNEKMNSEEAREYMEETDVNRKMLIDYFNGVRAGDDLFDITFNTDNMDEEEIVGAIVNLMKYRKLI